MGVSFSGGPTPVVAGGLYVDIKLNTPLNVAIFAILLLLLSSIVATELLNIHVPYSKFAQEDAIRELPAQFLRRAFSAQMSSRKGFFILYFLPLISYVILWAIFAADNMRLFGQVAPSQTYSVLLFVGWCLTFGKRCYEVLFVHIYSGAIPIISTVLIAVGYSSAGLVTCAFANQVFGYQAFGATTVVKDSLCVIFFVIGIVVNFISHYQLRLARLRVSESNPANGKRYLSPAEIGWLFKIFICPHYVFETVMFVAWSVFGATSVHYMTAITVSCYLGLRTRATYKWYVKKGLMGDRTHQKTGLLAFTSNPLYDRKESH
jgi:hypothetical protein